MWVYPKFFHTIIRAALSVWNDALKEMGYRDRGICIGFGGEFKESIFFKCNS